jgi:hypothetical protein
LVSSKGDGYERTREPIIGKEESWPPGHVVDATPDNPREIVGKEAMPDARGIHRHEDETCGSDGAGGEQLRCTIRGGMFHA